MSNLREYLLRPRRVALIGASGTPGRVTARPQSYLAEHGFEGEVFPVNPGRAEVQGIPAYASIADVPGRPVDHAYVLLDTDAALDALDACGQAGVPVVTMLADGFAESGPEGLARQARLAKIAARNGTALVGPNSMGVVSGGFACTTNPVFANPDLPGGRFAVISQSGSIIGAIASRAAAVGLGFGAYVSTGNEACLGVGEIGALMVDDPTFDGFVLFLETLRRPDKIAAFAAEAARLGKPVVAYLVGRSEAGSSLAASHTGAMAGGARAIEAFLAAHGIHLLENFEALAETANAMPLRPRLRTRPARVTVITTTGGGGGMVFDRIGMAGLELTGLTNAARTRLAAEGLDLKPSDLVDVTLAGAQYKTMRAVIEAAVEDPDTGLVVAAIGSSAQFNPELAVKPIVDVVNDGTVEDAPIVAVPIPNAPESLSLFNGSGVPAFRTPESAAEGIVALFAQGQAGISAPHALDPIVHAKVTAHPAGALTEVESSEVFASLGIRTPPSLIVRTAGDLPTDLPFQGPYVLKVISRDILHKTDIGGVALGLSDHDKVAAALEAMRNSLSESAPETRIDGYLVQQMASGGLGEAIIGLSRDPVAGPMISVGMGGVMTEIYRDLSLRPAPVSVDQAAEMLQDVKGFALLRGYRGAPRGDLDALAHVVARLSTLALAPSVREAEINPVLVLPAGEGVIALDALIVLGEEVAE
ncbi:MAG: acetate--CoA ligase family protein [Paracoccaceae bacterium]